MVQLFLGNATAPTKFELHGFLLLSLNILFLNKTRMLLRAAKEFSTCLHLSKNKFSFFTNLYQIWVLQIVVFYLAFPNNADVKEL